MKQYKCIIFQLLSPDTQHNRKFFFHLWELGAEPPHLEQSLYAETLDKLLDPLIEARKRLSISEVTTLPARRYLTELDHTEIPIPDEEFSKFISEYRKRTTDTDYPYK